MLAKRMASSEGSNVVVLYGNGWIGLSGRMNSGTVRNKRL